MSLKIAYVGDFINHGKSLQTAGTSIVILLSLLEDVNSIDVYCPEANELIENFILPEKVKLFESYRYDDPLSILLLLKINWSDYDIVIFNMLPTGFGNGSATNALALMLPILLTAVFRARNIRVIYHNSVYTNDVKSLGYDSKFNRVRSFFLGIVEREIFKHVQTFVLLDFYKNRIDNSIGRNKVKVLNARYLEAITTVYINNAMGIETVEKNKSTLPTILMHGSWGPQKNIELGLSALQNLRERGTEFKLVISGGINHHFKNYKKTFSEIICSHSDLISGYRGAIREKDIMNLFLETDLLILPYNTPGGHSGVLEQALFFEVPTIAIDFPEYEEQAIGLQKIKLVHPIELEDKIYLTLRNLAKASELKLCKKITEAVNNMKELILK